MGWLIKFMIGFTACSETSWDQLDFDDDPAGSPQEMSRCSNTMIFAKQIALLSSPVPMFDPAFVCLTAWLTKRFPSYMFLFVHLVILRLFSNLLSQIVSYLISNIYIYRCICLHYMIDVCVCVF